MQKVSKKGVGANCLISLHLRPELRLLLQIRMRWKSWCTEIERIDRLAPRTLMAFQRGKLHTLYLKLAGLPLQASVERTVESECGSVFG